MVIFFSDDAVKLAVAIISIVFSSVIVLRSVYKISIGGLFNSLPKKLSARSIIPILTLLSPQVALLNFRLYPLVTRPNLLS